MTEHSRTWQIQVITSKRQNYTILEDKHSRSRIAWRCKFIFVLIQFDEAEA